MWVTACEFEPDTGVSPVVQGATVEVYATLNGINGIQSWRVGQAVSDADGIATFVLAPLGARLGGGGVEGGGWDLGRGERPVEGGQGGCVVSFLVHPNCVTSRSPPPRVV